MLKQTYQNFELIILDDCSNDNSREIIEFYRNNPHVTHIVYNEKNSGRLFSQWQKGIGLAKGILTWIAESDDSCLPFFMETLVRQFENNENVVLAFCKTTAFTDDKQKTDLNPIPLLSDKLFCGKEFISHYMTHGCPIVNASSCIFKSDVAKKVDQRYAHFKGAGDRLFWTEISEFGDVAVVNEWLNLEGLHAENTTIKCNKDGTNQKEDKEVLDYIYTHNYISPKEYRQLKRDYVKVHIFEMLTDNKLRKELYALWDCSKWDILSLKMEAWRTNICRTLHSNHIILP